MSYSVLAREVTAHCHIYIVFLAARKVVNLLCWAYYNPLNFATGGFRFGMSLLHSISFGNQFVFLSLNILGKNV